MGLGSDEERGDVDTEVEEGEEVDQVPTIALPAQVLTAEPILVPSSDYDTAATLIFPREFGIPSNHPIWAAPTLPIEILDPPAAYPPILLPNFNEEKYATLPTEGEDVNAPVDQGNKIVRAEGVVAEGADGVEDEG
ncbi:hypothetical protein Acr_00g0045510 [Actinidia rufa]|uniref:Uncharacterized protein n=1 Tax=Actinidia rufa TaxID=165716 RepID=A0A7J0DJ73_9ERIC|nr:hypothetical protein Acr_00g0045510 [Actinidia rufa]